MSFFSFLTASTSPDVGLKNEKYYLAALL